MLNSPLTLLVMVYGRKKKRTKFDNVIGVLVSVITLSTSMFVVSESFIPSVSADVVKSPIGWPPPLLVPDETGTMPADFQGSAYTPSGTPTIDNCITDTLTETPEIQTLEPEFVKVW